jgi:hypothetical protein
MQKPPPIFGHQPSTIYQGFDHTPLQSSSYVFLTLLESPLAILALYVLPLT